MGIENNAKHLAVVKSNINKLRDTDRQATYFLVIDKATKSSLLHVMPGDHAGKFKSPRVIKQRLSKLSKLDPRTYDDFFSSKKLVSSAGALAWFRYPGSVHRKCRRCFSVP